MIRFKRTQSVMLWTGLVYAVLAFFPEAQAQDQRTQLVEGAKREGGLVWYTSTSVEDIKRLFDVFNKRYPFIRTEFYNAGSASLYNRILNESRAGKLFFDLVAIRGVETHRLIKEGFLQQYISPESAAY